MSEIPCVKTTCFRSLDERGISEHDQALEKHSFSGHNKNQRFLCAKNTMYFYAQKNELHFSCEPHSTSFSMWFLTKLLFIEIFQNKKKNEVKHNQLPKNSLTLFSYNPVILISQSLGNKS